jgi:hypothetical protein
LNRFIKSYSFNYYPNGKGYHARVFQLKVKQKFGIFYTMSWTGFEREDILPITGKQKRILLKKAKESMYKKNISLIFGIQAYWRIAGVYEEENGATDNGSTD